MLNSSTAMPSPRTLGTLHRDWHPSSGFPPVRFGIQRDGQHHARMAAPKKVDYERIEAGWRAGIKSPSQLAAEYTAQTGVSVSHAAIIKHFKKLGVTRDLSAKVKAKADSMVMEAMVTGKVSVVTTKKDAEIIDQSALIVANVQISHRQDITRSRSLVMNMMAELEAICGTENAPLLVELGDMMRRPDQHGQDKFNDLYQKLVSLPGRAKTMKDLGDSLKTMIGLEREAFNMNEPEEGGNTGREMSDAELAVRLFDIFGDKAK